MGPWAAKLTAIEAVDNRSWWQEFDRDTAIAHLKGTPFRKRDDAAEHGTAVHKGFEAIAKGAPRTDDEDITASVFRDFLDRYGVTIVRAEYVVANYSEGYAGSGDLLAYIGGELWQIDHKTSMSINEDYELQQAAYRRAEVIVATKPKEIYRQHWYDPDAPQIEPVPLVERVGILHVPREAPEDWQLVELRAGEREYQAFLAVKSVFDYRRWAKQQPEPVEYPAPTKEAA